MEAQKLLVSLRPAYGLPLRNEIIEAMISGEGETVDFTAKVDVMKPGNAGAVECWLVEVEESMMDILREVTDKSNKAYPSADRVKPHGRMKRRCSKRRPLFPSWNL